MMEHDVRLRAAARAVYDVVYPTDEFAPVGFDEAERFGTIHYRRVIEAAAIARLAFTGDADSQLSLL